MVAALTDQRRVPTGKRPLGVEVRIAIGNLIDHQLLELVLHNETRVVAQYKALFERLNGGHHIVEGSAVEVRLEFFVAIRTPANDGAVQCFRKLVGFLDGLRIERGVAVLIYYLVRQPQVAVGTVHAVEELLLSRSQLPRVGHVADFAEGQITLLRVGKVASFE